MLLLLPPLLLLVAAFAAAAAAAAQMQLLRQKIHVMSAASKKERKRNALRGGKELERYLMWRCGKFGQDASSPQLLSRAPREVFAQVQLIANHKRTTHVPRKAARHPIGRVHAHSPKHAALDTIPPAATSSGSHACNVDQHAHAVSAPAHRRPWRRGAGGACC